MRAKYGKDETESYLQLRMASSPSSEMLLDITSKCSSLSGIHSETYRIAPSLTLQQLTNFSSRTCLRPSERRALCMKLGEKEKENAKTYSGIESQRY